MKKILTLVLLTICLCCIGCSDDEEKAVSSSTNVSEPQNLNIQISADYSKDLQVPNPEKSDKDNSIVMRYIPDFEKYDAYDEKDKCYKSCDVDLSFLGFKNKMRVLAFQTAEVTGFTSACVNISYEIPTDFSYKKEVPNLKNRKEKGNCLVLVVKDSLKDEEENDYIVVLDYENKKSYTIKTTIWNPMNDHIPNLYLRDLTGDGLKDIVISNSLNETDAHMQVFRFDKDSFKCIYNAMEETPTISGTLVDDYKVVIECKETGLKKKIDLLDVGYTKKKLQNNLPYVKEKYPYSHVYKNGKVKNDIASGIVNIDTPQDIELCTLNTDDETIRYSQYVSFAKYNNICKIYVNLKYNEKNDKIEVYKIVLDTYVIEYEKYTEKEWDGFYVYVPYIKNSGNHNLEVAINDVLKKEAISWILNDDTFTRGHKPEKPVVLCKNNKMLSIELSYRSVGGRLTSFTNHYITVDLEKGSKIEFNELIKSEKKLLEMMKKGETVSSYTTIYDMNQKESDNYIRKRMQEMSENELKEIIKQCKLSQKDIELYDSGQGLTVENRSDYFVTQDKLIITYAEGGYHYNVSLDIKELMAQNIINEKYFNTPMS